MIDSNDAKTFSPLSGLIRFFLEQKLVVVLLTTALTLWGLAVAPFDWELGWLPRNPVAVDAIPDLGENQQIIFTEWPGHSPQDVEDQVTYPLTVALMGVPGVREVRSTSMFGFSMVFVIFREDVEFYWSRARIIEKLNSLPPGELPVGTSPALGPDATGLGQIYWYTLEGRDPDGNPVGGWDLHELRSVQDWYVRYGLLAAEGISEVASIGGYVREYQVDVDPDAMRAHEVTLRQISEAVRMSNLDVGARTTEINRVEYIVRGIGFLKSLEDIEQAVVRAGPDGTPIRIRDVATVALGPAERRGALTISGAEAVGGVAVVREGFNPLAAINNVKAQIGEISPGLPVKAVVDWDRVSPSEIERFAEGEGFEAFAATGINQDAWREWLRTNPRETWPEWVTTSRLTIEAFYDRSGLIDETLGTLNDALFQQILVTMIVVIVMVLHLRTALVISAMLPLAVLFSFIAMKLAGIDANVVALAGIAIAIGTIVDMGVIVVENLLKHLREAREEEPRIEVVFRATREVGSAILTATSTTIVSFLPVFTMTGESGKMFIPLAFTKTFVLVGAIFVALTIVPAAAHVLIAGRVDSRAIKRALWFGAGAAAVAVVFLGISQTWPAVAAAGVVLFIVAIYHLISADLPGWAGRFRPESEEKVRRAIARLDRSSRVVASVLAVVFVAWVLTGFWEPLGPELGFVRNFIFVALLIGGLLGLFGLFALVYKSLLAWSLQFKAVFLAVPLLVVVIGFAYVWQGPELFVGPLQGAPERLLGEEEQELLQEEGLLERRAERLVWSSMALSLSTTDMRGMLTHYDLRKERRIFNQWNRRQQFADLSRRSWEGDIERESFGNRVRWTVARDWSGLGREFMPALDEGSFLWMPTTMPHASIGEALEVLQYQDLAIASVPEVETVAGKIGRAETALDPAPISMIETVINYKSEYRTDAAGRRINFRYDREASEFVRDDEGELIPDRRGRPYRQWRDHIRTPGDIWDEIVKAAELPGTTSAPRLQPIETRLVMLQTGMRAPMGVKVRAPDLEALDRMALKIEGYLREIPQINAPTVNADRVVGKPYLEIHIDREAIGRYGLNIADVQDVIMVAIGGRTVTTTVEGRERYPVRVRYPRELRGDITDMEKVLVPSMDGRAHVPLGDVAEIRYVRGPQMIRSEDTFLVGYVTFGGVDGMAEVEVVETAQSYLNHKVDTGELSVPPGVSWTFAGTYEHQQRAAATLQVVLPAALAIIFLILYFQFKAVSITLMVFSGIAVAWGGGFIMIWFYGQPWFGDFPVFGVNMRELFQLHPINLSVAVWVGFLALFGIAVDNGVVVATYLKQIFSEKRMESKEEIRKAAIEAGLRRLRPCLMTTATTILALLPVLTATGRGADIMIPMAIPSVGGMFFVLLTLISVPVLYAWKEELALRLRTSD